jgi:hypothetical protein
MRISRAVSLTAIARVLATFLVAAGCLIVAGGTSAARPLTASSGQAGGVGGLAPSQVAVIAGRMMQTLAPTGTPTVTVFATTLGRAETIIEGSPPPGSKANRIRAAELMTVRGRLLRHGRPVGRTLFGCTIWIPNGESSVSLLLPRAPRRLGELGRGTTYNLALQQPASAVVTVQPLAGIGPVSLVESRAALQRALGPWLLGAAGDYQYALGATVLDLGLDRRHVQEIVSEDPDAVLDGVRLGAGYTALREQLHGWRSVQCTVHRRMLALTGMGGRTTELVFDGSRFVAVSVGLAGAGGCPPWLPSYLATPIGQL